MRQLPRTCISRLPVLVPRLGTGASGWIGSFRGSDRGRGEATRVFWPSALTTGEEKQGPSLSRLWIGTTLLPQPRKPRLLLRAVQDQGAPSSLRGARRSAPVFLPWCFSRALFGEPTGIISELCRPLIPSPKGRGPRRVYSETVALSAVTNRTAEARLPLVGSPNSPDKYGRTRARFFCTRTTCY